MANKVTLGVESLVDATLVIVSGTTFRATLIYMTGEGEILEPVDMTGWTAYLDFFQGGERKLDCDGCVACGSDGTVSIHLPPAVTSRLEPGTYDYDIILVEPNDNADALRIAAGKAKVTASLSHAG